MQFMEAIPQYWLLNSVLCKHLIRNLGGNAMTTNHWVESEVSLLNYLFLGDVFDRAGVVLMIVQGQLDENAAKELSPGAEKMLLNAKYYAIGEFIKS